MLKLKKGFSGLVLLAVFMVVLSGCGNLTADITVNQDNTISADLTFIAVDMALTKVYLEDVKEYLKTQGYEIQNESATQQEGFGVTSYSAKKTFDDFSLFINDMKQLYSALPFDNKGEMTGEFKDGANPFLNSRKISVKVPLTGISMDTLLKSVGDTEKETIDTIIKGIAPGEQAELIAAMDQESWATAIGAIAKQNFGIAARITAPDENFSTNSAMFNQDPKAAIWYFSSSNDESAVLNMTDVHTTDEQTLPVMNNSMIWVSEAPNVVGIAVCSILLLAVILFLIVKFGRRPKKETAEGEIEESDAEALLAANDFEDFSDVDGGGNADAEAAEDTADADEEKEIPLPEDEDTNDGDADETGEDEKGTEE